MDFITRLISGFAKKAKEAKDSFVPMIGGARISRQNLLLANKNWVAVAVDRVAYSTAGIRFKVMKKKAGQDIEVTNGPLFDFITKPHPNLTWNDFVYLDAAYKEITGNAFWRIDDAERGKKTFFPMIPTRVTPVFDKDGLAGYKYMNGLKIDYYPVDRVLHDKLPSLNNPFWGAGQLEKIAEWVDTDAYASEFNRLFFVQGASFGGFIETEEESRERIELIRTGFYQRHVGLSNMHKVAILPKNAKFKEATQTMKDMQFAELDDRYRDKILAAFGVPKTLVGLTTEVNRASAEAAEYVFAKYVIEPKAKQFVNFLNNYVVPLYDKTGSYYVSYDNFIPVNKEIEIKETEVALNKQPYMTINEVRSLKGLAPISGGDVVYGTPFNAPIGEPVPQPVETNEYSEKSVVDGMVERLVGVISKDVNKDAIAHKEFVARVDTYQAKIAEQIKGFNLNQKNTVIQNLNRLTKAVTKNDLFDFGSEVGVMIDMVGPLLKGLFTEELLREYADQNFEDELNLENVDVAKIIAREAARMAKSYNKTTVDLLKTALNEGITNGEGINELSKRVGDIYDFSDKYRAGMVAQTESYYVANKANKEAYVQSGVVKTVRWYTADTDACQYCGPLNGKSIGVKEVFFEKGAEYTGKDGGVLKLDYRTIDVPPIHPNCRCFIRPDEISVTDKSVDPTDRLLQDMEKIINE